MLGAIIGKVKSLARSLKPRNIVGLLKTLPILAALVLLGETIDLSNLTTIILAIVPLVVVIAVLQMLMKLIKGMGGAIR